MGKMSQLDARGITDLYSYSEGFKDAEERIIKLLEDQIKHDWFEIHCESCDQTDYLIALIKGENK